MVPNPFQTQQISYHDNLKFEFFRKCFEERYRSEKMVEKRENFRGAANYACIQLEGLGERSHVYISPVRSAHSERVILAAAINWAIGIARKRGLPQGNIKPIDLEKLKPKNNFTD